MDPRVTEVLKDLATAYGPDNLRMAAEAIIGKLNVTRQLPAEYFKTLSPEQLHGTVYQLDASVDDLIARGQAREEAYGNKAELLRQKSQLETQIKLEESQAIMEGVSPDGKSVKWNGTTYPFTNDLSRDAFRMTVSAEARKKLAEVEGDIQALDVALFRARDGWEIAKEASESVRRKAHVQAELLNWLAGGR